MDNGPFVVRHSTAKKSLKGEDFACSEINCKWPRNSNQKFIHFGYHGIFDGHGGQGAALMCKKELLEAILDALDERTLLELGETEYLFELFLRNIGAAMVDAFQYINDEIIQIDDSGTTCTVVMHCNQPWSEIQDGQEQPEVVLVCANVGDSHAYFYSGVNTVRLNSDHRLDSNKSECERVKAAGGKINNHETKTELGPLRLYPGGLMMSRTIGDSAAPQAIPIPEVRIAWLPSCGGRITIASDGLWDISTGKQASKTAHAKPTQPAAQLLVLTAQKKDSRDDITVTVVDLLPYQRRAEKLVWSLPNGQLPTNLNLPEVCDELAMYDPLLTGGAVAQSVVRLREKRLAVSQQIKTANEVMASRSKEIRKEGAERIAEKDDVEEALRIMQENFENTSLDVEQVEEWTVKPKKVSKKAEATAALTEQALDLLIQVLFVDGVFTIAQEETKRIAEEEAKKKAEYKQKQREKKLQKQREERIRREALERQRQLDELEQEKSRALIAAAIDAADLQADDDDDDAEKKQRRQQERDNAEKVAAMAAREALGGASRLMKQESNHDSKANTLSNNKNQKNDDRGSTKREKMNGLNKSELMQVKSHSKVNDRQMLSASDLEASFHNNGWNELSVEPPPGTNFSMNRKTNLQQGHQAGACSNSMAISFESQKRIIPMSPIMKPLKSRNKNRKQSKELLPPPIANLFGNVLNEDIVSNIKNDLNDQQSNDKGDINKQIKEKSNNSSKKNGNQTNSNKVLHVSKYPKGTSKEMIGQVFSKYAEVTRVFQKEHGKISYCFVTMKTSEDATKVMGLLNNNTSVFGGDKPHHPLKIEIAADKDNSAKKANHTKLSNQEGPTTHNTAHGGGGENESRVRNNNGGGRSSRKPRVNKPREVNEPLNE